MGGGGGWPVCEEEEEWGGGEGEEVGDMRGVLKRQEEKVFILRPLRPSS